MVLVQKHKKLPSAGHKKRYGQHRKHTKPYLKPYWPYLPIIAIIALGIFINSAWSRPNHGVLGYSTNISSGNLLADTNSQRQDHNETPLKLNDQLSAAAQTKANDMAKENFWSHYTPSGEPPWAFIKSAGYNYERAGENLAYGFSDSSATLSAWMNSPEHRANILNQNFQDVGFGIANATNYLGTGPQTIVVAMYGQPANTTPITKKTQTISPVFTVAGSSSSLPIASIQSKPVSRLQTLIGQSPNWLIALMAFLAGTGLTILIFKHALAWHKVIIKSEAFIIHHPWLDVLLVTIIVGSVIVSQGAGTIL